MVKALCLVAGWVVLSTPSFGATNLLIQHQYPLPGAVEVSPGTNIGVRVGKAYDASSLTEGAVEVRGSKSGLHKVELHLSLDRQTLLCHPIQPFAYGESVHVTIRSRLLGGGTVTDTFQFSTMSRAVPPGYALADGREALAAKSIGKRSVASEDSLPTMTIVADSGATPGTIYLANFSYEQQELGDAYLFNLDEHGTVVRKQKLFPSYGFDFKRQPNGLTTYFDYSALKYYGLDSNWNVVDSFGVVNDYYADDHELRVFRDGGYALLATSKTSLYPSQFTSGLDSLAVIQGSVIQVFDAHHNETFEWRGIDHYQVTDAIHENLEGVVIDFEHANSLDFDSARNIIVSNRNLSEITKINGKTGEIMWRLGGAHNQFTLIGDSVWFSYQHAARIHANGHLTLFDNANFDSVIGRSGYLQQSRAVEYILDTVAMTATLAWQWHHTPETFSMAMGYVERLPNGNTMIGWGEDPDVAITEVRPDKSTAFEMVMGGANYSYRAIKYVRKDSAASSTVAAPAKSENSLNVQEGAAPSSLVANFVLDREASVSLKLFDLLGHEVSTVLSSIESVGQHSVTLSTQGLSSGTYYCALRLADGNAIVRPFALWK